MMADLVADLLIIFPPRITDGDAGSAGGDGHPE